MLTNYATDFIDGEPVEMHTHRGELTIRHGDPEHHIALHLTGADDLARLAQVVAAALEARAHQLLGAQPASRGLPEVTAAVAETRATLDRAAVLLARL